MFVLDSIMVIKESGEKEAFDESKIRNSMMRVGISGRSADKVLDQLKSHLKDGITTKRIYSLVYAIIDDLKPEVSHKFNLKRALLEIGPAGYEFEDFMSRILALEGYDTKVRQILEGGCVSHEIDITAKKGKNLFMVECKFHNEAGMKCRIQSALYVYARYLDLAEGAKKGTCPPITHPWLVTNTKFSEDVIRYAECTGFPILGWRYPFENSLEAMIDRTKCYPVSVLPLSKEVLGRLLSRKLVTIFDIPESAARLSEITGFHLAKSRDIIERAEYARK